MRHYCLMRKELRIAEIEAVKRARRHDFNRPVYVAIIIVILFSISLTAISTGVLLTYYSKDSFISQYGKYLIEKKPRYTVSPCGGCR